MEVWLKTNNEAIRLPITPSIVGIDRTVDVSSENVLMIGEIPQFNGRNLKTVSLSSFFPKQNYSFAYKTNLKTYDLANKFIRWHENGQQLRFVVTGTYINMVVLITSFNTREQDGTGDLYFDMELKEYREPKIVKLSSDKATSTSTRSTEIEDKSIKKKQKIHKVVKGDTLIKIAKKYYGNSDYKKIANANKAKYPTIVKNPSLIKIGWELIIP